MFPCEFYEIFKNIFFTEHVRATAFAYAVMGVRKIPPWSIPPGEFPPGSGVGFGLGLD